MSDDEVDELLKAVDTSSGEINYVGMLPFQTFSPLELHELTRPAPDLVKTVLAN